jgi:hypothetical protein
MAKVTQLCVCLENKPGQLAKMTKAFLRAKVNMQAISVVDTATCGVVRVVASPVAKAKAALVKAGMSPCQQTVLLVKVKNEPGTVSAVVEKLSAKGINIDYVYGSAALAGKESMLVLGVDQIDKAAKAL